MEGSSHCAVFFKKHEEKTLFNNLLSGYSKRNYFFVTKSIFLIPISSQPDGVNLWYFKLCDIGLQLQRYKDRKIRIYTLFFVLFFPLFKFIKILPFCLNHPMSRYLLSVHFAHGTWDPRLQRTLLYSEYISSTLFSLDSFLLHILVHNIYTVREHFFTVSTFQVHSFSLTLSFLTS